VTTFLLPSIDSAPIPYKNALAEVLDYCRRDHELVLSGPRSQQRRTVRVPSFAYQLYDCTPPAPEDELSLLDILVIDGLNGRLGHKEIAALAEARTRAWPYMAAARDASAGRAFWELPHKEIKSSRPPGGVGDALARAFEELERTPGVGLARAHKVLHHKMPRLFPLIDRKTVIPLRNLSNVSDGSGYWSVLWGELRRNESQFDALEADVNSALLARSGACLSRLRLHDILLWRRVSGK
jgi:hypothetical protein